MKKELIVHSDPKSPISEIFRTLRTNIQFMNTKRKLKTILVTSSMPGEGKSWVSSNLAVTFAQTGKRVVLIDADMRKGRQYAIFKVSPRPGLSNYLSGVLSSENDEVSENISNYLQETEVDNLYMISAGNVPPNPSELLISPQMINLLEYLKEMCDIIIIDGTPSQLVTDSLILARLVDTTLIVTQNSKTKKADLKRVITNIQNVGGKIAGIVINKMPISSKKFDQSYYYGSTSTSKMKKHTNKVNKNVYDRTVSLISNNKNETKVITRETTDSVRENKDVDNTSDQLENKLKIGEKEGLSIEKTNDILKQINEYIDNTKKDLDNK